MRKRLLLVEDDPDILRVLTLLFDATRYHVLTASDLDGARAITEGALAPDAVLLDMLLPDGDGLEFCQDLKNRRPTVRVVVLTADVRPEVLKTAAAAGADLCLTKPFDVDAVESCVERLLVDEPASTFHPEGATDEQTAERSRPDL